MALIQASGHKLTELHVMPTGHYMVVGTLSLVQKGQTNGCSFQWTQWNCGIWWWGHCLWCKKVKAVHAVDTVCSECSRIVVYDGQDIVFGTKRSKQWMHYGVYAVEKWSQYAVDAVE